MPLLRHPYELGGAYWLMNMAYTQVSAFVVLSIGASRKYAVISDSDLWIIAVVLTSFWLIAIISLFLFGEKKYKHTFYQKMRAWEYVKAIFDTGIDTYRISVFENHHSYYKVFERVERVACRSLGGDPAEPARVVHRRKCEGDPARSHTQYRPQQRERGNRGGKFGDCFAASSGEEEEQCANYWERYNDMTKGLRSLGKNSPTSINSFYAHQYVSTLSLLFVFLWMNPGQKILSLFEPHDLPQADTVPTSFSVRSSFRLQYCLR